jgi:hypothetical protein
MLDITNAIRIESKTGVINATFEEHMQHIKNSTEDEYEASELLVSLFSYMARIEDGTPFNPFDMERAIERNRKRT